MSEKPKWLKGWMSQLTHGYPVWFSQDTAARNSFPVLVLPYSGEIPEGYEPVVTLRPLPPEPEHKPWCERVRKVRGDHHCCSPDPRKGEQRMTGNRRGPQPITYSSQDRRLSHGRRWGSDRRKSDD